MKIKLFSFLANWMPMILYCVAIYALSSSPIHPPGVWHADKVIHFFMFALLGALVLRGLNNGAFFSARTSIALALGFSCLFGFLDEFHQFFVPGRDANILDFFSDVLGSFFGVFSYAVLVSPPGKDSDNAQGVRK